MCSLSRKMVHRHIGNYPYNNDPEMLQLGASASDYPARFLIQRLPGGTPGLGGGRFVMARSGCFDPAPRLAVHTSALLPPLRFLSLSLHCFILLSGPVGALKSTCPMPISPQHLIPLSLARYHTISLFSLFV